MLTYYSEGQTRSPRVVTRPFSVIASTAYLNAFRQASRSPPVSSSSYAPRHWEIETVWTSSGNPSVSLAATKPWALISLRQGDERLFLKRLWLRPGPVTLLFERELQSAVLTTIRHKVRHENRLTVLVCGARVIQFDGEAELFLSEAVAVDGDFDGAASSLTFLYL